MAGFCGCAERRAGQVYRGTSDRVEENSVVARKTDGQVSNFGAKHIQEFIDQGVPLPTVNQIDLHPFMRHPDIVDICQKHSILLEVGHLSFATFFPAHIQAWGPLARAMRFDHPSVQKIAKAHKKDQAQVMLRWGVQHVGGIACL